MVPLQPVSEVFCKTRGGCLPAVGPESQLLSCVANLFMVQEIGGNDINSFVLLERSVSDIPAFAKGLGSAYADALGSLYGIGSFLLHLTASRGNRPLYVLKCFEDPG